MLLVTGGAGFIGSNVVAALNEAGRSDIVVNDVLGTDQKWRNLAKRQVTDVVAPADLFRWLDGRKLDAVIHMGAISDTTASDADVISASVVLAEGATSASSRAASRAGVASTTARAASRMASSPRRTETTQLSRASRRIASARAPIRTSPPSRCASRLGKLSMPSRSEISDRRPALDPRGRAERIMPNMPSITPP